MALAFPLVLLGLYTFFVVTAWLPIQYLRLCLVASSRDGLLRHQHSSCASLRLSNDFLSTAAVEFSCACFMRGIQILCQIHFHANAVRAPLW